MTASRDASDVYAAMGLAVFRRQQDRLLALGPVPQWWRNLRFDDADEDLSDDFLARQPFLQHFLEDANSFWDRGQPGRIDSGIWEYPAGDGHLLYLQVYAVVTRDGYPLLVVQDLESTGVQLHDYVQRGRETHLKALQLAREQQQLQQELRRAEEAAELLQRSRTELLGNVSHELRTPLTSVRGLVELLAKTQLDGPQRDYLQTMRQALDDLQRIVQDLLETTRTQAAALSICPAEFGWEEIVTYVEQVFAKRIRAKSLTWTIARDERLAPRAWGDATRLKQVIGNLIDNAAKFTDQGGVEFRIAPHAERRGWVSLAVADTGIGMSPAQQQLVFDAFLQLPAAAERGAGGLGLGLSLCAHITHAMGGELRVESTTQQGTTVRLELPLSESLDVETDIAESPSQISAQPDRKLKVLVVEDNPANRLFLCHALGKAGHEVVDVDNGDAALEQTAREDFDLVLLDCQMPRLSGFDTVRAIRKRERRSGGYLPVLAITAHVTIQDVRRCREAGMDSYLTKPFSLDELWAKVRSTARLKRMTVLRGPQKA